MGGEGGSSFDGGKAGAFRNGAWGSGMCVCVWGESGLDCGFLKLHYSIRSTQLYLCGLWR